MTVGRRPAGRRDVALLVRPTAAAKLRPEKNGLTLRTDVRQCTSDAQSLGTLASLLNGLDVHHGHRLSFLSAAAAAAALRQSVYSACSNSDRIRLQQML